MLITWLPAPDLEYRQIPEEYEFEKLNLAKIESNYKLQNLNYLASGDNVLIKLDVDMAKKLQTYNSIMSPDSMTASWNLLSLQIAKSTLISDFAKI